MGIDLKDLKARLRGLSDNALDQLRGQIMENAAVGDDDEEEDRATAEAIELIDDEIDRRG